MGERSGADEECGQYRKIATYIAWAKDETISLKEYLEYAISMNWVDVSGLGCEDIPILSSEEIYQVVVDYISSELATDSRFSDNAV